MGERQQQVSLGQWEKFLAAAGEPGSGTLIRVGLCTKKLLQQPADGEQEQLFIITGQGLQFKSV